MELQFLLPTLHVNVLRPTALVIIWSESSAFLFPFTTTCEIHQKNEYFTLSLLLLISCIFPYSRTMFRLCHSSNVPRYWARSVASALLFPWLLSVKQSSDPRLLRFGVHTKDLPPLSSNCTHMTLLLCKAAFQYLLLSGDGILRFD